MLAKQILDELAGKIGNAIAESPVKDVEKNVKTLLGSTFGKLDLVTREDVEYTNYCQTIQITVAL